MFNIGTLDPKYICTCNMCGVLSEIKGILFYSWGVFKTGSIMFYNCIIYVDILCQKWDFEKTKIFISKGF